MPDGSSAKKIKLLLTAALCGAGIVFLALYFTDLEIADIKNWIKYWTDEIQTWPAILFF
jgi:hypothetical protein